MSNAFKLLKLSNILRNAGIAQAKLEKLLSEIIKDQIFQNKIFICGGFVRDYVKQLTENSYVNFDLINDLDLVIQLNGGSKLFCDYLINLFDGYIVYEMLNPNYPTYNVKFKQNITYNGVLYQVKNSNLDISDTAYKRFNQDSNHQKLFIFGDLKKDVMQRDFTINSLYKNISNGIIYDLTHLGVHDIEQNILRTIPNIDVDSLLYNNPKIMLRFCRFYAKYQMKYIYSDIMHMRSNAERILTLEKDSIMKELSKVDSKYMEDYIKMAKYINIYQYLENYVNQNN